MPAPLVGAAEGEDEAEVLLGVLDALVTSLVVEPMRVVGRDAGIEGTAVALTLAVAVPLGVSEAPTTTPLTGAATALLGSTRLPTPQGMAAPPLGWLALAGGVVAPVVDAMVKRVVQVALMAPGAVNW